jgi:hypothetical protein
MKGAQTVQWVDDFVHHFTFKLEDFCRRRESTVSAES